MGNEQKNTDFWDKYDQTGIGVGGYTNENLFLSFCKGDILEVGCGRGGRIGRLSTDGKKFAIDPSKQAIDDGSQEFKNVNFVVGDACNLPYADDTFDFVYSIEVLEHVHDYNQMIREMARVAKKGAYIYIQTPNYPAKRFYDFIYWMMGRRASLEDDYTHVTKLFWIRLVNECRKNGELINISTRNILGENLIVPFKKQSFKQSPIGLTFGQKTIVVLKKHEN